MGPGHAPHDSAPPRRKSQPAPAGTRGGIRPGSYNINESTIVLQIPKKPLGRTSASTKSSQITRSDQNVPGPLASKPPRILCSSCGRLLTGDENRLLNTEDVAALLNLKPRTVTAKAAEIGGFKMGRKLLRYRLCDVLEYRERQRQAS
jgi:hypothetical protein